MVGVGCTISSMSHSLRMCKLLQDSSHAPYWFRFHVDKEGHSSTLVLSLLLFGTTCSSTMSSGVRKRVITSSKPAEAQVGPSEKDKEPAIQEPGDHIDHGVMESGTYWLTRIVFIRSIGLIYCKSLNHAWCSPVSCM